MQVMHPSLEPLQHLNSFSSPHFSNHCSITLTDTLLGGFLILVVLSRQNGIVGALAALARFSGLAGRGGRNA